MGWLLSNAGNYVDTIVLLGTLGGGIGWVWRMIAASKKQVDALLASIETIQKELIVNNGTSMFDVVNRTLKQVDVIAERQSLQQSWQYLFANTINAPLWESDANGMFTKVNGAFVDLTGRSSQRLLGVNWENSVAKEDRDRVRQEWRDAVNGTRNFECNFDIEDKSGNKIPVTAFAFAVMSGDNHLGHTGKLTIRK